jgi:protocatechuate 3,4-dioxygenase beta subunit
VNDHPAHLDAASDTPDVAPATPPAIRPRISRRAALRTWITRAAPLVLLTACIGPTSATPAGAAGGSGAGRTTGASASGAQAAPASIAAAGAVSVQSSSSAAQTGGSATSSGQAGVVRQALPACIITPQQTEGPYFVDERLDRSDIRSDPSDGSVREGVPLLLTMQVTQVDGGACTPLAGTYVDIWQCDAHGVYSDVDDRSTGSRAGTSKFLRGYQVTDENGMVQFTTIFPGWYGGRAVHIHFKVRTALDARSGREMVSQLYFDDALIDQIHALPPYASKGQRTVRNSRDGVFRNGGDKLIVPVTQDGEGYAGTFHLGVQLT